MVVAHDIWRVSRNSALCPLAMGATGGRRRPRLLGLYTGLLLVHPLSSMAEDAFARVCREKLRVIYWATMQFVAEHDGYLPPAWMSADFAKPFQGGSNWSQYLKPYLEAMGERTECGYRYKRRQPAATVTHCPANPYWYGGYGPNCIGYAWNSNFGLRAVRDGKPTGPPPVRFDEVRNKERTILIVDAAVVPDRPPYCVYHASRPTEAGSWHDGKAHVLFLDGHVEALRPDEIQASWFKVEIKESAGGKKARPRGE